MTGALEERSHPLTMQEKLVQYKVLTNALQKNIMQNRGI